MAAKLAAARMASWSGVRVVIAAAHRPNVLVDAVAGVPGVGTVFPPAERRLSARKLWIAFALPPVGRVVVDDGARRARRARTRRCLPAGVVAVEGSFEIDEAVEIVGPTASCSRRASPASSRPTPPNGSGRERRPGGRSRCPSELVHRDDLVVLDGETLGPSAVGAELIRRSGLGSLRPVLETEPVG